MLLSFPGITADMAPPPGTGAEEEPHLRPLYVAACEGHVAAMLVLLEAGAAVDRANGGGELTALQGACQSTRGTAAVARVLLESGANPDALTGAAADGDEEGTAGFTALHLLLAAAAADARAEEVVEGEEEAGDNAAAAAFVAAVAAAAGDEAGGANPGGDNPAEEAEEERAARAAQRRRRIARARRRGLRLLETLLEYGADVDIESQARARAAVTPSREGCLCGLLALCCSASICRS